MIKKLFLWSVLLMTGFAFYSCDDVIDNPATGKQDPSNPNASWIYEVKISFEDFNFGWYTDKEGNPYKYEVPSQVYVYNSSYEKLGILTKAEEDGDQFSGMLKGALGEKLIISTLDDFDFYSKQDGTMESLIENSILQTAEVPIIVTDTSKGKIGTQSVKMKNQTAIVRFEFDGYARPNDHDITISCDSLILDPAGKITDTSMNIKLADEIDPYTDSEGFFFAVVGKNIQDDIEYHFTINDSENGYTSEGTRDMQLNIGGVQGAYCYMEFLRSIDLTKYFNLLKEEEVIDENYHRLIRISSYNDNEVIVNQSGEDVLPFELDLYADKATIKGINIKYSLEIGAGNNGCGKAIVNVEGDNTIMTDWYSPLGINGDVTLTGTGTLTLSGQGNGFEIWSGYRRVYDEEDNETLIINGLTIGEGVTVKASAKKNEDGDYNTGVAVYGRDENDDYEWTFVPEFDDNGNYIGYHYNKVKLNIFSKDNNIYLIVNGTLEAEGGSQGIYSQYGIVKIGETGSVKAISRNAWQKILFSTDDGAEAKLEDLVADKTKFNDTISEDNTTRIITKK